MLNFGDNLFACLLDGKKKKGGGEEGGEGGEDLTRKPAPSYPRAYMLFSRNFIPRIFAS